MKLKELSAGRRRATEALAAYTRDIPGYAGPEHPMTDAISDLIADLLHLAAIVGPVGGDPRAVLTRAVADYEWWVQHADDDVDELTRELELLADLSPTTRLQKETT